MKVWWPMDQKELCGPPVEKHCSRVSQTEKLKNNFIGNYECQIKVNYYM